MEEKVKHRIVGAFVLLALLAIFIPVTFKNQLPLDRKLGSQRFQAPPPPVAKKISPPQFQMRPVAHVDLNAKPPVESEISAKTPVKVSVSHNNSQVVVNKPEPKRVVELAPKESANKKRTATTAKAWMIQLGSFSDTKNAKNLETSLQAKGYAAFTSHYKNSKGIKMSRLVVGPEIKRQKAEEIQKKIAQLTNIKGIIVEFDPRVKTA